jgi:hypothetical protein
MLVEEGSWSDCRDNVSNIQIMSLLVASLALLFFTVVTASRSSRQIVPVGKVLRGCVTIINVRLVPARILPRESQDCSTANHLQMILQTAKGL